MKVRLFSAVSALALSAGVGAGMPDRAYAADVIVETVSDWAANGSQQVRTFGENNSGTYGQTFIVPTEATILDRYRFRIYNDISVPVKFEAFLAEWDPVAFRATGPILFQSGLMSTSTNVRPGGFEEVIVTMGGLRLDPTKQYVAFLSNSNVYDGVTDGTGLGVIKINPYPDGMFVYSNNFQDFDSLFTTPWGNGLSWDLAFELEFSIPTGPAFCSGLTAGDDICSFTASDAVSDIIDALDGTDTFELTGSADGSFDQDLIGATGPGVTAALLNFEIFRITGTGTWSLTGDSTAQNVNWIVDGGFVVLEAGAGAFAFTGTDNSETFVIRGDVAQDILGLGGNDTIRLESGTVGGDLAGGLGDDLIEATGGTILGNVDGGGGNDAIVLAVDPVDVLGGTGDDTITLNPGTVVTGSVFGDDNDGDPSDDGDDTIFLNGGTVAGAVFGEGGNDAITINDASAAVPTTVDGGLGNDQIIQNGGWVLFLLGGAGDDRIESANGSTAIFVDGGAGSDTIILAGNVQDVFGGTGADVITLDSTAAGSLVFGDDNDFDPSDDGNDIITLDGPQLDGVFAEGGDDIIVINAGTTVTGTVFGDDNFAGPEGPSGDGNDMITMFGGTVGFSLQGNGGDDQIGMFGGSVTHLFGNAGSDLITVGFDAAVTGSIFGDDNGSDPANDGNDTIVLLGGAVGGSILGEGGDDTLQLDGATVDGALDGGDGADVLMALSGSVTDIFGGNDDDTILLVEGVAQGTVSGDGGSDDVILTSIGVVTTPSEDVLDGGDDASSADGQIDLLRLEAYHGVVGAITNFEFIELALSSDVDLGPDGRTLTTERLMLNAGSRLTATGSGATLFTIDGDFTNEGELDLVDGITGDRFAVTGDYQGGGQIMLDVFLADSAIPADTLSVGGSVSGVTALTINNTDPSNQPGFTGPGILLVDVDGASGAGDFVLTGGAFVLYPFEYDLVRKADNNWYLQSALTAESYTYATALIALQQHWYAGVPQFTSIGPLTDRRASQNQRSWQVWADGFGSAKTITPNTPDPANFGFDQNTGGLHGGAAYTISPFGSGRLSLGAFAGYAWSQTDHQAADATMELDGASFGVTAGYAGGPWFADLTVKWNRVEFNPVAAAGGSDDRFDGAAVGLMAAVGRMIELGRHTRLQPRLQGSFLHAEHDDFVNSHNATVASNGYDSYRIGGGIQLSGNFHMGANATIFPFIDVEGAWQSVGDEAGMTEVNGFLLRAETEGAIVHAQAGLSFAIASNSIVMIGGGYEFGNTVQGATARASLRSRF